MQLVEDPAVSMINTMTNKKFNEKDVIEKFGVKPNQIRDMPVSYTHLTLPTKA